MDTSAASSSRCARSTKRVLLRRLARRKHLREVRQREMIPPTELETGRSGTSTG